MRFYFLFAAILLCGCSSLRMSTHRTGADLQEAAISFAIQDFSKSRLFKRDSVFCVHFEDSVFHEPELIQVEHDSFQDGRTHQWKRGSYIDGVVCVCIAPSDYSFFYSEETLDTLPTKYVIVGNKLFYWKEDSSVVTDSIIEVLSKYGVLQFKDPFPFLSSDDSHKGADYYFCKNDLSKNKRIITSLGFGYYEPPRLRCR